MLKRASIVVALVAFLGWRNGRSAVNTLILSSGLPSSYYAYGTQDEKCRLITAEATPRSADADPNEEDKGGNGEFASCEDAIFWDTHDGKRAVLASCDPFRSEWNTIMGPLKNPKRRGSLWIYDVSGTAKPQRIPLEGFPPMLDFKPLGIDIWDNGPDQPFSLFVINHRRGQSVVEFFELYQKPLKMTYRRAFSMPAMCSPNNIAATGPKSFYMSQDHFFTRRMFWPFSPILPMTETLLGLPLSWVNHVNFTRDNRMPVAAGWLPFANGVAISPDGTEVAVATTSLSKIHFYSRNTSALLPEWPYTPESALTLKEVVAVPFNPDNIVYEPNGDLTVAGHPHFPSVIAVAKGRAPTAPSWVISVQRRKEGFNGTMDKAPLPVSQKVPPAQTHDIVTLYQSDGTGFSTSSSALVDRERGKMYITGLYARGMLECDI